MEVLSLFGGLFVILTIRWIWLININAQKAKKLLYAIAMLQFEQIDKENGAETLRKILKSSKSDLDNDYISQAEWKNATSRPETKAS